MDLNEITSLYDNFFSDNSNNLSDQNYFQNQFCNQTTSTNNSDNYFSNYIDNNVAPNYNLINIDNYTVINNNNNNHDQYNINNNRPPFLRIIKQRKTANKKERRRTQSINNAFSDLRDCIPSIPADTKLSKIKTLRLATSYIAYLSEILANDTNSSNINDFQVDLSALNSKKSFNSNSISLQNKSITMNMTPLNNYSSTLSSSQIYLNNKNENNNDTNFSSNEEEMNSTKSTSASLVSKGRTGWPHFLTAIMLVTTKRHKNLKNNNDLSLWISEEQVRVISGISMEIYVIYNGIVSPILLDPNFEEHLQVVPAEVNYVNFTWKAGNKKYFYNFNRLKSFNEVILKSPVISIKTEGKIPKKPKEFSVFLICHENSSGNATFDISLLIENHKRKRLPGTPIKLKLKKECSRRGPDPQCDKKCSNRGWCNHEKICQCQDGYVGQYCHLALCYPQCMNGGNCTSPGTCNCPIGFQGKYCEGGICNEKCLNGGKCIQKDTCDCSKGFYGPRCEFSKCVVPCLNGGKCIGVNKCRCLSGFRGNHCEIEDF